MKQLVRPLRVLVLTFVSYLLEVCVMQHLYIGPVTANACLAGIAVITVSYGKKAAFCSGCIIGILMECMLANVPVLYLLSYPIITMLCAQWFADLSDRQRERRKLAVAMDRQNREVTRFHALYTAKLIRVLKRVVQFFRRDENMNPYLRIPLCALTMALMFNTVLAVYGYISDFGLDSGHIFRALASSLYTTALALVLMLPYRAFLKLIGRGSRTSYVSEGEQA
ncbi:MAG: hypothetical protein IJJ80_04060 [Clostridia bacterium]|nr:hypothetical protein [Clostridia bacterium]MBQ6232661.1 hypothetical protein [Clostridia bacterium]